MKRTKIVATIGPATESLETLKKLITAGMNVARLNMSHGDHSEHAARIQNIRSASSALGVPVAILLDLSGPKIRTGSYYADSITIEAGSTIILTTQNIIGNEGRIYINYENLPSEVYEGTIIMVDDGKKKLVVTAVLGDEIHCTVLVGGELKSKRGVNIPGAYLTIPTITEKDRADLAFGLTQDVDMIALSFVRRVEDVHQLKKLLADAGHIEIPVIVKIETQESIDNLDAILEASDGAMVARGDLAIEVPAEKVPLYQKQIIATCLTLGRPVITATQMLESMIKSPVPTRAEVSDIANAILDGTDAVMLSEETALGLYPVEAVAMMTRIAESTEATMHEKHIRNMAIVDSISAAVCKIAEDTGTSVIVVLTERGSTANRIARFKPSCPIVAMTPHIHTLKALTLVSGVHPYKIEPIASLEELVRLIPDFLRSEQLAATGDIVTVVAGMHFGISGSTNMLFTLSIP